MGMRLIPSALVVVATLALAACGGGEPPGEGKPPTGDTVVAPWTISSHAAPDAVVVDITQPLGGLVPPEVAVDERPQFRLYGDGTVIALPVERSPGGFPALETYRLSGEGVEWVLRQAEAAGLLGPAPDYGEPAVTDVGTVTVTISAAGIQIAHSVYAPGFEDEAAGLTPMQIAARRALARFVDAVVSLPESRPDLLAENLRPYVVDSLAVWAWELPGEVGALQVEDWPLAEPLGRSSPEAPSGAICFEVAAKDAAVLEKAFEDVQGLGRAWRSGTTADGAPRLFTVGLNPILPGDAGCPDTTS